MERFDSIKDEYIAFLAKLRADAEIQLDLFDNGTCRMTRNGEDITSLRIEQVREEIAALNELIAKIEGKSLA